MFVGENTPLCVFLSVRKSVFTTLVITCQTLSPGPPAWML